jgi:hypothetical protein
MLLELGYNLEMFPLEKIYLADCTENKSDIEQEFSRIHINLGINFCSWIRIGLFAVCLCAY